MPYQIELGIHHITNYHKYTQIPHEQAWMLYKLTFNDGCYYIGISSQPEHRLEQHRYSYKSRSPEMTILAIFPTREMAEQVEWRLYQRLRGQSGCVEGFSPLALVYGMGGA